MKKLSFILTTALLASIVIYAQEPVEEHTYTVAGAPKSLFGTEWNPTVEANDMVKQEDGTFKFEKADVALGKGSIEFKVVEDHAWVHAWPAQNYKLAIPEDGIYTIEITFDPAADDAAKVGAKAIKTGEFLYITKIANSEQGSVFGPSKAVYLDSITIEAVPNYGYHFTQWSDGLTENPRTLVITQDTTFTAEFALDRTGTCGTDLALTWTYEPEEKVLTISGTGAFNDNMQCGVEARTVMQKVVFENGVTSIGTSAFANCATLKTLVLSKDVKKIYENAFYNCENLTAIYNYRPTPSNIYSNTFSGVDKFECILYVPDGSIEMYKSSGSDWKDFFFIESMGSADDEYTVTYVDKDEKVLDSEKIKLHLPEAPSVDGLTFLGWRTVASFIESNTIVIEAVYEAENPTSTPAEVSVPANSAQKLVRNGNVYILTSEKVYTITGQEVNQAKTVVRVGD